MYLQADRSRTRAAQRLTVHPNTTIHDTRLGCRLHNNSTSTTSAAPTAPGFRSHRSDDFLNTGKSNRYAAHPLAETACRP
ncbi:hypothetical protein [Mycobacterium sp. Aquia_216]|uniref:hypothetical protein n=1 Tax=Mycobacterium sp. Aquia_216 TaxID=2991729 RepID=UPI003FA3B142